MADDPIRAKRNKAIAKLRLASRKSTLDLDAAAFVTALRGESDRGAIIFAATIIDDRLWAELDKRAASTGLADNGKWRISNSFASRIELAREIGMVAPPTADMIDVVREMRNACAHGRNKLTFRSPVIIEAMNSLLADGKAAMMEAGPTIRRDIFVVPCGCLAATILGGLCKASLASIEPILIHVTGSVPKWVRRR